MTWSYLQKLRRNWIILVKTIREDSCEKFGVDKFARENCTESRGRFNRVTGMELRERPNVWSDMLTPSHKLVMETQEQLNGETYEFSERDYTEDFRSNNSRRTQIRQENKRKKVVAESVRIPRKITISRGWKEPDWGRNPRICWRLLRIKPRRLGTLLRWMQRRPESPRNTRSPALHLSSPGNAENRETSRQNMSISAPEILQRTGCFQSGDGHPE